MNFLFSVDLEDYRMLMASPRDREGVQVRAATRRYLELLRRHKSRATFFVVGKLAAAFPDLVEAVAAEGHEIAWHSHSHEPLTRQTADGFRRELEQSLEALARIGIHEVKGFRAPSFSSVPETEWIFAELAKHGFTYSSSVLPAKNPLFGWPGFGSTPKRVSGVWEIPMTLGHFGLPLGGGIYFRTLPVVPWFRKASRDRRDIVGYFHPYDVEDEFEPGPFPEIGKNPLYNFLIRRNRKSVIPRIEKVLGMGFEIIRYDEYVTKLEKQTPRYPTTPS